MKRRCILLAALACASPASAQDTRTFVVPTRDGVGLHTLATLPPGDGPFPAVVIRSPCGLPTPVVGRTELDEDEDDPGAVMAT